MAKRQDFPKDEDLGELSREELDKEIRRVTMRRATGPDNALFRTHYESRLFLLNKFRQRRLQELE